MKLISLRTFCVFALLLSSTAAIQAQSGTYANLTVTGTADLQGDTMMFGTWTSGTTNAPGLTLGYANSGTGTINFIGSGSMTVWGWWKFNSASYSPSMVLDQNNDLLLYSGTVAGVTLSPSSTSVFNGNVTFSGSDNEMPNQTLIDSNSVLTVGMGDARYFGLSVVNSGDPWGDYGTSVSLGGGATSAYSIAIGGNAGNGFGTAVGFDSSSDAYSTAIGYNATASEAGAQTPPGAVAIGNGANANGNSGDSSIAIGAGAYAGNNALAIGPYTYAGDGGSMAVGLNPSYAAAGGAVSFQGYAYGVDSVAIAGWADSFSSTGMSGAVGDGMYSMAIGSAAYSSGQFDICFGSRAQTSNGGGEDVIVGAYASSSSYECVAIGYGANTQRNNSIAIGFSASSTGVGSTAIGQSTTAQAQGECVVGTYNIVKGTGTSWVATDDLFVVGSGTSSGSRSDAFVVSKNGDTKVSGGLVVSGSSGTSNTIANGGLAVTGTSVNVVLPSGTAVSTMISSGTSNLVLLPQQGDLSMGAYVAGQQPPAVP